MYFIMSVSFAVQFIFYVISLCVPLIHCLKYDIRRSNSLQDLKQNHCTMKYRSLTNIFLRHHFVSHTVDYLNLDNHATNILKILEN